MKTLASATDLQEIQQRLGALTVADQRLWGRMSVHEMVCHVRDSFTVALGEQAVAPVRGPLPPPILKWLALATPMRWPQNIATAPELEPRPQAANSASFASIQREVLEGVDRLASASTVATDHPFFGHMSARDWLRWGYLHTDHHLRQFGR